MKLHSYLIVASLLTFSEAFASLDQAPPSFPYKAGKAIFVDFTDVTHSITYDLAQKTVTVDSVIEFESAEEGYPLFDLGSEPRNVSVDGQTSSVALIPDPDKQTSFRIVDQKLASGHHEIKLSHTITTNVVFDKNGVASAFWLSDLTDRKYLEQYLPSNIEFDQHPRHFKISIEGAEGLRHIIKANGKVSQINESSFEVDYPAHYTNSSVFFHMFPSTANLANVQFYYPSIDGRMIPVDIYTSVDITPFIQLTKDLLQELESDYGAFPHDQVIIYGNSLVKGGMEYSGATATGLQSLGHELFHSYNARGVMPANGNAGWMDEAMARWRDNNYPLIKDLTFSSTQLGGHSVWQRFTDGKAYTEGSAILSRFAFKMAEKGLSFKTFLKDYYQRNMHTTVTTPQFQEELTLASGLDLASDFNRYIYGKVSPMKSKGFSFKHVVENLDHPQWTKEELLEMTFPK